MNKKFIVLFIIFLVAILAIGSVGAANLKNRDFDGYFTMKVPKDVSFQKEENSTDEGGIRVVSAQYTSENLVVLYMDSLLVSENSSGWFYQTMFEGMCPDLDECYETQEGDVVILEPKTIDETHFPIAGKCSGNKIIMIMGNDVDSIEEMVGSVEFN